MNEEDCKDPSGLAIPPPVLSSFDEQDQSMASVARQQQEVAQLTSDEDLPYSRPLIRDVIRDTLPFSLFLSSSSRSSSFCNYWRLAGCALSLSLSSPLMQKGALRLFAYCLGTCRKCPSRLAARPSSVSSWFSVEADARDAPHGRSAPPLSFSTLS